VRAWQARQSRKLSTANLKGFIMSHPKEYEIIVNTIHHKVLGPSVTFDQILQLDGVDTASVDLNLYDVDWTKGDQKGSLNVGGSVPVQNGMRFDAGKSNRS
jgi:hypothetical protein